MAVLVGLSCGRPAPPVPQSMTETLTQFLGAVKANDLERMGRLWGTQRGPAVGWMDGKELRQRLAVIQRYLAHAGSRIVEGPIVPPDGRPDRRTFRVELQRERCNVVFPIELVRSKSGGWLVLDVHLESVGNPVAPCPPAESGTRR